MGKQEIVTSYHWNDPHSVIQRIDVREQSNGFAVAYLYANPDPALKETRLNIRAAIRYKGWGTLSDHRDEKFALRVSGLRSGDALISMLQSDGFVSPPTQRTTQQLAAEPAPSSLWGKLRANSLQWSGIIATIGNSMSFMSGIHRGKDWGQIGQGLAFGVADLPLMIAGSRDDARQLSDFLRQLKKHYDKEGIEIPRTASIYVETSDAGKTFGERAMDYLHRYANQIKCSMEVVAAGFTIHAGKTQNSSFKKFAPFIWGPGFLASLLIPERQIDEDKYAQAGPLGRFWMKIQSNPLSVGGILGYSNTVASYGSAIKERNASLAPGGDGRRLYRWDFAIPTVMIGANGLYAMSKKTVGGDIKSEGLIADAYTVASQIINKQPEDLREKAIESTARFFAERTEIKESYRDALARLHKEVEIQRQNPWFEPQGLAHYTPMPKPRGILKAKTDASPEFSTGAAVKDAHQTAASDIPAAIINAQGLEHVHQGIEPEALLTHRS